jgi:subtilase family serine protease
MKSKNKYGLFLFLSVLALSTGIAQIFPQLQLPAAEAVGQELAPGSDAGQGSGKHQQASDPDVHPPVHFKPDATISPAGYSPAQIKHAYGFNILPCATANTCGAGQTIAIIDAYDDPNAAADLATFSNTFGLPPCTVANGCFSQVYASGFRPSFNSGWALEISLDVQWAHAVAPQAKIMLVEARNSYLSSLLAAVDYATSHGAKQVSMSWGASEFSGETSYDYHFNKAGVTFFASAGDGGSAVLYPAVSRYVTGVGGTSLYLDSLGNVKGETAWSGSGGGKSSYEFEPSYQTGYRYPYGATIQSGGMRGVPDVSYDANPNTGVSVYDSAGYQGQAGWFLVGGTSAGAPQWAALAAIVNSGRTIMTTLSDSTIYSAAASALYAANYRDITSGSNGYSATTGYDFVTGLGSPLASSLVPYLQTH